MSFDGDLYPTAGASKVITSKGDLVRGDASGNRERYGIGSTSDLLTVVGGTPTWVAPSGGGGTVEFIETITQASDLETFDVNLSSPYVYANYDHLLMTWNFESICAASYTAGLQMRYGFVGTTLQTSDYYNIAIYNNNPDGLNKIFWSNNAGVPLLSDTTVGQGVNDGMSLNGQIEFYNNKISDSGTTYWNKPFFYRSTCNQFNSSQSGVGFYESNTTNPANLTCFQFAFYEDDYTKPSGTYGVAQNSTVSFWGVKNT